MTAFSPGQSPPLVKIPIRLLLINTFPDFFIDVILWILCDR
jgi:hypothetical protein